MSIKSWPYVSIDGDRKITAADEAEGYDVFVQSGVVPTLGAELAVGKVPDTMNVVIAPGKAVIAGHRYIQPDDITLTLDGGDANPRIDIVALESNKNTLIRATRFVVVKGTPSASPSAPDLIADAAVQQQEYARVLVPAGAANLNGATLTDTRKMARGRHDHELATITGLQTALNDKANSSHNHNATNITAGTLPLGRGGTGATSASGARTSIGAEAVLNVDQKRKITISSSNPSGGSNGDIWIKY